MSNVLISSVSKKIPLIRAVREASNRFFKKNQVIGADLNPLCIARYFVDRFWEMSAINDLSIADLISYCQKEKIHYIIPTRDGELLFFSQHKKILREKGIHVMISSIEGVIFSDDKYFFSQKIEGAIPTALDIDAFDVELYVVKERHGACGDLVGCQLSKQQAMEYAKKLNEPVFQPFVKGQEVSVDLYIDDEGKAHGAICRERNLIQNGESQITTTFRDASLEKLCSRHASQFNLYGHVMFQIIRDQQSGKDFFLECNSRFGGASTASLKVGLDSFYWFFLEANGQSLPAFVRSQHEVRMIRHAEDTFVDR